MALDARGRRRWLGALALAGAVLMLVAGETVLNGKLSGVAMLVYWLACLVLTMIALLAALLDVKALQSRTRREQRDLLESTLQNIADEARERRGGKGGRSDGPGSV